MPTLKINGTDIEVEKGTSVLQACEMAGVEIPRFCYHERLSVPANCRMCLVEQKGAPKPIASCAVAAADGMEIETDSALTRDARNGVMEMLLINHPLDCPICDQGGECDLQDQAMAYGFDRGRYAENKRAVKDKYMGPLIKTFMTRCIHCTRCIRVGEEICGVEELGLIGRGEDVEISTFVEAAIHSELSGNMIDVCPVGALTSKPYQFEARPWELKKTPTIDVMDALGSNIRIDSRGGAVLRALPRLHEDINEEWLGDKSRFAVDGLARQRLDRPYLRVRGTLKPASWEHTLDAAAKALKKAQPKQIAAIAGDQCDVESLFALKGLMDKLKVRNIDCRQDGGTYDASVPAGYRFNTTIAGLEEADRVLLIGTNPRAEAVMINARLRKRWLRGGLKVASIGPVLDLTYPVENLGAGPETLKQLVAGKHGWLDELKNAERPVVIAGQGAFARPDGGAIHHLLWQLCEAANLFRDGWAGFNMLHGAAARVGALELGFVPRGKGARDVAGILEGAGTGEITTVWLQAADELPMEKLERPFVIYQGHHGDRAAAIADVILPGAAWTEKPGTYLNTEGRPQQGRHAVFPPGDAREDWRIIRALSERLGEALPYDSLAELRGALRAKHPHLLAFDSIAAVRPEPFGSEGEISEAPFALPVDDYYMTCPISRCSETMARCIDELRAPAAPRTGTNG